MAGRPPPPRYTQLRTATRGSPDRGEGSRTITIEQSDDEAQSGSDNIDRVLTLRGGPTHGNRVTWQEGTVDNEFLNRKKSKICCIFHKAKPKNFEDPFAESSSSSSSDDSGDDSSTAEETDCSSCKSADGNEITTRQSTGNTCSKKGKERARDQVSTEDREATAGASGSNGKTGVDAAHDEHQHTAECTRKKHKSKSRRPPPNAYEHQPSYGKAKAKKRNKGSSTMTVTEETTE